MQCKCLTTEEAVPDLYVYGEMLRFSPQREFTKSISVARVIFNKRFMFSDLIHLHLGIGSEYRCLWEDLLLLHMKAETHPDRRISDAHIARSRGEARPPAL